MLKLIMFFSKLFYFISRLVTVTEILSKSCWKKVGFITEILFRQTIQISSCYFEILKSAYLNFNSMLFFASKISVFLFFSLQVLVMTPQILLHNLSHCFITMEMIALLIFDECHHAQVKSNHAYAVIMKVWCTLTQL